MEENLPIIAANSFEDEVVVFSTRTMLKLMQVGADAFTLYGFYCLTAKRQSIALRKRIVTVKANQSYVMEGLGWGEARFRSAKKLLIDNKLVFNVTKRGEGEKILGYYIQINYVPTETSTPENQLVDKTSPWASPVQEQPSVNTVTKDNSYSSIKDNTLKSIDIKDIRNTDKGGLTENYSPGEPRQITESLLIHFNTVYNTKYRAVEPLLKPVEFWTKHYSIDEIKQAITNSIQDKWWADKLTPTILFRRMNPNHEAVDYIGKFLNMPAVGTFDATPLTPIQLWKIAKENEINLEDVQQKHKDVLTEATKGSFPVKYKYDKVEDAVRAWVDMGISKGSIKHCNELELMQLDNDHPDKVKEREYYFGLMREKGELE